MADLIGPQGPRGPQGPQGEKGDPGQDGRLIDLNKISNNQDNVPDTRVICNENDISIKTKDSEFKLDLTTSQEGLSLLRKNDSLMFGVLNTIADTYNTVASETAAIRSSIVCNDNNITFKTSQAADATLSLDLTGGSDIKNTLMKKGTSIVWEQLYANIQFVDTLPPTDQLVENTVYFVFDPFDVEAETSV